MSVINLSSVIHAKKQAEIIRNLDLKASLTALEVCLNTLNINDLEEVREVKEHIKKAIQKINKAQENAQKKNI